MKKFFLIPLLFGVFMLNVASTCSNDDDSNDDDDNNSSSAIITQTQNTFVNGSWRVTLFSEDGSNQTSQFLNYDFVFGTNGSLTAENGSTTMNGTWTTGTDDSTPKFIINFSATNGPFEEISEDWQILNASATRVELKHVSRGDGSIDMLTFEKN